MSLKSFARDLLGPPSFDEVGIAHRLLGKTPSVLVDVGAHIGSSLLPFAREGWTIFAFEPDPMNRAVLLENVAGFENVHVDDRAISSRDDDEVALYTSDVSTGISSLSAFHPSHQPTAVVRTVRLDTFLGDLGPVGLLKTDTEGHDLPVLQTYPWASESARPHAVVCEFENRKSEPLGYFFEDLADFLVGQGYVVLVSEWFPIVRYGQLHRWRSVYRYPAALADPAGWGNLIAVEPWQADKALTLAQSAGRRLRLRSVVDRLRKL